MSIPVNLLRWAGVWDATTSYSQYDFVQSPIDSNCYIYVGVPDIVGGTDPSVSNPLWVLLPQPKQGGTEIWTTYFLPNGGVFQDNGPYTGSTTFTIDQFTMPPDTVPNSTAMLWFQQWAGKWSPAGGSSNVLDFRLGFSPIPSAPISNWFTPAAGWVVQAFNANNIPNPIPLGPHFPPVPNSTTLTDYFQFPQYTILNGVSANQPIYINGEIPYGGNSLSNITIIAPFLLYQRNNP